ncbi:unnamed protein product, partial [Rotaria sordida]
FDHGTLEDMMDKDNGVRNRRNAKRHDLIKEKINKEAMLITNGINDNDSAIVNTLFSSTFNIS